MLEKFSFWHPYMIHWGSLGYGSGRAYEEYMKVRHLVSKEYRIRKKDFLAEYRQFLGLEKKREDMIYTGKDRFFSEKMYHPRRLFTGRRYHTSVKVRFFDYDVGEEGEHWVTIAHDTLMKRGEIEEMAMNLVGKDYPERGELRAIDFIGWRNTRV